MIWEIGLFLYVAVAVSAVIALVVHDLLVACFLLMAYSFGMALLYAEMGAVDVAFTEAAIGAGISGVFLIIALFFLKRRSDD